MECGDAQARLVAMQDDELAPSETLQVREHVATCGVCSQLERRLEAATPMPEISVPPRVRAQLHARLDLDQILAAADRVPSARRSSLGRAQRWLQRDAEIPNVVLLAATVLLTMSLSWGLSSWWSLASLQAELAEGTPTQAAPAHAGVTAAIPAEQFRPASYTPEEEEVFH